MNVSDYHSYQWRMLLFKLPFMTDKVKMKSLSRLRLFATPWTVAYQGPLSMGFSRQEYWSGLLLLSPGDLPNPGIESRSPAWWADALPYEPPGKPCEWCFFSWLHSMACRSSSTRDQTCASYSGNAKYNVNNLIFL